MTGEWLRADNDSLLYAAAEAPDAAGCEVGASLTYYLLLTTYYLLLTTYYLLLTTYEVVASRGLETLLHVSGTAEAPLRDLTLRNLTWEHTEWSMPPSPQPADFQVRARVRRRSP